MYPEKEKALHLTIKEEKKKLGNKSKPNCNPNPNLRRKHRAEEEPRLRPWPPRSPLFLEATFFYIPKVDSFYFLLLAHQNRIQYKKKEASFRHWIDLDA